MRWKIFGLSVVATVLFLAGRSDADAGIIIFPVVNVGDAFSGTFTIDPLVPPMPVINGGVAYLAPVGNVSVQIGTGTFSGEMSDVGANAFAWDITILNNLLFNGVGLIGGASDFAIQLIGPITPSLSITPLPLSSYQFGQLLMDPFNLDGIANHFTAAHYKGLLDTLFQTDATDFSFTGHITEYSQIHDVPEPSTWVMMLIGFAGLGYASYRRTKRSAVALVAG